MNFREGKPIDTSNIDNGGPLQFGIYHTDLYARGTADGKGSQLHIVGVRKPFLSSLIKL